MSTDCLFTVMVYKISGKSSASPVLQEMFPVCNVGCVVSAAGCRWCLGRVPLPAGDRLHFSRPYLDVVSSKRLHAVDAEALV